MTDIPAKMQQMISTVTEDGRLELALREVDVPHPKADEVLVKVGASPINPSDQGVMFTAGDVSQATALDGATGATMPIPEAMRRAVAARVGKSLPLGNEGAGTVVAAGDSPEAQALVGKVVAGAGGGYYANYRIAKAADCLPLPDGITAEQGASSFVNPLTALGMVGTMRLDGYKGLVHTAAASNLGQMLVKLCKNEGVPLVNIVRSDEQVQILRDLGAEHIVNSSEPDFHAKLVEAIAATEAFLAFDAIGGGKIANQILAAMEAAALKIGGPAQGPYGSRQFKQVYIYGGLSTEPTTISRGVGMQWGIGGFLLTYFLERVGPEEAKRLREKVGNEITTTFASAYTQRIGLEEAVTPDTIRAYQKKATGEKYLVVPNG